MSILSTLAFLVTAVVRPDPRNAEIAALKAQIDDLKSQLYETRREVARWRMHYERAVTLEHRAEQLMQAQAQNQMAQAPNPYQHGLAQIPNQSWYDCTCVPARHDMLLGALPVLR
jgi:hypothetical protein